MIKLGTKLIKVYAKIRKNPFIFGWPYVQERFLGEDKVGEGKRGGGRKRIPRCILIFDSHSFGNEKSSGKIISVSDEKSADIANR